MSFFIFHRIMLYSINHKHCTYMLLKFCVIPWKPKASAFECAFICVFKSCMVHFVAKMKTKLFYLIYFSSVFNFELIVNYIFFWNYGTQKKNLYWGNWVILMEFRKINLYVSHSFKCCRYSKGKQSWILVLNDVFSLG